MELKLEVSFYHLDSHIHWLNSLQLERLSATSAKYQEVRDELDVVKVERDTYFKKANITEKYKQKLEASQKLQKENSEMRDELNEVREQLKSFHLARQQFADLEVANEEYKRTLPKIEQDRHELQIVKQHLEFDNAALAQRCVTADEQHARDKEQIASLTDTLHHVQINRRPSSIEERGLEAELNKQEDEEAML